MACADNFAVGAGKLHGFCSVVALAHFARKKAHAFALKLCLDQRGSLFVVALHRPGGGDHCHFAAKSAKRLRHFHAYRARTDDRKMLWQLIDGEQVLVGEDRYALDPVDRRNHGPRAGGYDDPGRAQHALADTQSVA